MYAILSVVIILLGVGCTNGLRPLDFGDAGKKESQLFSVKDAPESVAENTYWRRESQALQDTIGHLDSVNLSVSFRKYLDQSELDLLLSDSGFTRIDTVFVRVPNFRNTVVALHPEPNSLPLIRLTNVFTKELGTYDDDIRTELKRTSPQVMIWAVRGNGDPQRLIQWATNNREVVRFFQMILNDSEIVYPREPSQGL